MTDPKLRFKGFEQHWDEDIFSNVGKYRKVSNQLIHHQNLLSLSYGKIIRKDIDSRKGLLPVTYDTYQIVEDGTVVFRFTDLQNDKRSLRVGIAEEEGIISPAYVCVDVKNVIPKFFYYQMYSFDLRKTFYSMGDGLRQTLSYNDVKNMPVYFPTDAEQKLIVASMESIEKRISIVEKVISHIRQTRTGAMVSMFPQKGEDTPRVRFKGFDEPWRPCKLNSFAKRITRKNTNLESTRPLTISAEHGLIDQTDFFNSIIASDNLTGYYLLKKGEFAYNKSYSNRYPFGAVKRLDNYEIGVISNLYIVFEIKGDVSSDFISQYFETNLWHREVAIRAAEGARNHGLLNIGAEDFLDINIQLPHSLDEQQKIAEFFRNLDRQIECQTQILERLKRVKAACLDQMYV